MIGIAKNSESGWLPDGCRMLLRARCHIASSSPSRAAQMLPLNEHDTPCEVINEGCERH